jgi:hypothetical protein
MCFSTGSTVINRVATLESITPANAIASDSCASNSSTLRKNHETVT